MQRNIILTVLLVVTGLVGVRYAFAGQAPAAASDPDIPISHQDRVYSAEQYSNTVSVTDPVDNKLVGTIRLGDPLPANLSPLYKGQLLVHGMGFSPDHRTIAVVAIGSNAVSFIDTATNSVKHITYVGRSPHEAFYTMDGKEVWVVVRGENYVSVLDGTTYEEKTRIIVPNGPGMTIFSPDGKYGYVCSSFTPETEVITVADHRIVGKVPQASPFCPNIAATPDSKQVWFTLKDTGKTQVFDGQAPFTLLKTLDTGPITNHVNIARNANGMFAYVTIGGLNEIKVFRTDNLEQVATIPVGKLPHGIWPSGDGTRVYVGLENEDKVAAIDTLKNEVIATSPIGQAPQALVYVPDAVPAVSGAGMKDDGSPKVSEPTTCSHSALLANRRSCGLRRQARRRRQKRPLAFRSLTRGWCKCWRPRSLARARKAISLALSSEPSGTGVLEPLQGFMTNPAGAAIVNTIGPIRQLVRGEDKIPRRYLVIFLAPPTAPALPSNPKGVVNSDAPSRMT